MPPEVSPKGHTRRRCVVLALALGVLAPAPVGAQTAAVRQSLLARDLAVAAAAHQEGFSRALLPALADDPVLLLEDAPIVRGGEAARAWLAAQPELQAARVTWLPLTVLVSTDTTLGVTYGVTTVVGGDGVQHFGKYVSVWRREAGEWRIVAQVQNGLLRRPMVASPAAARTGSFDAGPGDAFTAADRAFAQMAADSGAPAAFAAFAAPAAVTFPGSGELLIGPAAIRARMTENQGSARSAWHWAPLFAGGAQTGDLGFTVGEATIRRTLGDTTTTFYSKYLSVWGRMPDGSIRFLADAGNARPDPRVIR